MQMAEEKPQSFVDTDQSGQEDMLITDYPKGEQGYLISEAAKMHRPKTVLDIACGSGLLLNKILEDMPESPIHSVAVTGGSHLNSIVADNISCSRLDVLTQIKDTGEPTHVFDMVIASEGGRELSLSKHGITSISGMSRQRKPMHSLAVWASHHLADRGVAILVLDDTFFSKPSSRKVHELIRRANADVVAAIYMPSRGYFYPEALEDPFSAATDGNYLVIIQRGTKASRLFVGRTPYQGLITKSSTPAQSAQDVVSLIESIESRADFLNPIAYQELLANLKARKNSPKPENGRFCLLSEFTSFNKLQAKERLEKAVRGTSLIRMNASEIFLGTLWYSQYRDYEKSLSENPDLQDRHNTTHRFCLYYNTITGTFSTTGKGFGVAKGSKAHGFYIHDCEIVVLVNPKHSTPEFLEYWFGESDVGKLQLASCLRPDTRSAIQDWEELFHRAIIFIPSPQEQKYILDSNHSIQELRGKIEEKTMELRRIGPPNQKTRLYEDITAIRRSVESLSSLDNWLEALPYPIASILWVYRSRDISDESRWKILIAFFEASCEFLSAIYLSTVVPTDILKRPILSKLQKALAEQGLTLQRSTFGTWCLTIELIGRQLRKRVEDPKLIDFIARLSGTDQISVLNSLFSAELPSIFREANSLRNRYLGHGGIGLDSEASKRLENTLLDLLNRLRGVLGSLFRHYKLIRPGDCTSDRDGFTFKVETLMGPRHSPFMSDTIRTTDPLLSGQLYLYSSETGTPLRLIPFAHVMSDSKQHGDRAFFYSRYNAGSGSVDFVSYDNCCEPITLSPDDDWQVIDLLEAVRFQAHDEPGLK